MSVTEKTIRTRYADIALSQSSGAGLPVLLLHGSGASKGVFAKQFAGPLADTHRMLAIDLPGHGQSSDAFDPAATYTVAGLALVVAEVLGELGIDRAAVFGWSLGGHVAIELLSFHAGIAGLLLTGTPPIGRGPIGVLRGFHTSLDVMLASKERFTARDIERFARMCFGDHVDPAFLLSIARADGRLRKIVFNGMMRGIGADQKRVVEHASVPIAIVNGEREPVGRLGYIASLAYSSLWDGQCHVIPGAGHAPFWEMPDAFNPMLSRFVEDVEAHEVAQVSREHERFARSA